MSSLMSQARTRVPRLAEAASVRARLSLVPAGTTTARRTPFVVLIFALLAGGVVGLLMFNTNMQQASFHATALQQEADRLTAQQQGLAMQLDQLRDPQRLARAARRLGMVVPPDPAFLRLSDGHVLGTPTVATPADSVRINTFPAAKPRELAPVPKIVRIVAKAGAHPANLTTSARHGAASASTGASRDRKSSSTSRRTSGDGAPQ